VVLDELLEHLHLRGEPGVGHVHVEEELTPLALVRLLELLEEVHHFVVLLLQELERVQAGSRGLGCGLGSN
jgi:hypothetical protein